VSPLAIILIVVLMVVLLGGGYGYRSGYLGQSYGYAPIGIVGVLIIILHATQS
jgi:hypothetical protein